MTNGSKVSGTDSRLSTASSLIRGVQSQDRDAWRRLTSLYGPLVYHWCQRMGLRSADSADVLQEVFLGVFRSIQRFEPRSRKGNFRGWLWTITRRKAVDFVRRRATDGEARGGSDAQLQLASLPDPFTDDSPDPTDQSETASLIHRGLELIKAEFEPRTWQAFWRATVDQHDVADIAVDLGVTTAAVRKAKSRVLRRLREILGDQV